MGVIDDEGIEWIRDPASGETIQLRSRKGYEVRAKIFEDDARKRHSEAAKQVLTDINVGADINILKQISNLYRDAIKKILSFTS